VNHINLQRCLQDVDLLARDERIFLALELLEKVESFVRANRGCQEAEIVYKEMATVEVSNRLRHLRQRAATCSQALIDLDSVKAI